MKRAKQNKKNTQASKEQEDHERKKERKKEEMARCDKQTWASMASSSGLLSEKSTCWISEWMACRMARRRAVLRLPSPTSSS